MAAEKKTASGRSVTATLEKAIHPMDVAKMEAEARAGAWPKSRRSRKKKKIRNAALSRATGSLAASSSRRPTVHDAAVSQ